MGLQNHSLFSLSVIWGILGKLLYISRYITILQSDILNICDSELATIILCSCIPVIVDSRFECFLQRPSSVRGWTSAFLLAGHRLCGANERRLSHFLPRWLRTGWQSVISQGKISWNTPPWLGIKPGSQGGQTVGFIHSPTEVSWLIDASQVTD